MIIYRVLLDNTMQWSSTASNPVHKVRDHEKSILLSSVVSKQIVATELYSTNTSLSSFLGNLCMKMMN